MVTTDRGQVFTLEAFIAALILLSSVVFALQVTAATPLSGSTSNQHVENQQAALASSFLDTAAASGTLRPTLLYWDDDLGTFHNASSKGHYLTCSFGTPFGNQLAQTFENPGSACNIRLTYLTTTGEPRSEQLVYVGAPTDNAVRRTTTVTLYDDDVLLTAAGDPSSTTLANTTTFYAPDAAANDPLYNVIEVEVIVWRM